MKRTLHALLLVVFSLTALSAADFSKLEATTAGDLAAQRDVLSFEVPAPMQPATYTQAPVFGRYDWTGIPLYVFTETTRVSNVLVKAIDTVTTTLDVALYNLQLPDAAQALVRARDRGVQVRVMIDYDHVFPNVGKDIKYLIDSGMDLKVMKGRGGSGSMHNKYAIFDGTALQMGSANWTGFAQDSSYENMMFVYDGSIINGYRQNFEWMWKQGRSPTAANSPVIPAGPLPADPNPSVNFNGTMFPKYIFSPRGNTEATIARAIDSARSSADVAMFTLTSRPIMDSLLRAAARGVKVRLTLSAGSKFPFFKETATKRIPLKFLEGRLEKGVMHNKYAVLDGKMLINGAYNWSDTAEQLNAENAIFTMDPNYVGPYQQEYNKLFGLGKPGYN